MASSPALPPSGPILQPGAKWRISSERQYVLVEVRQDDAKRRMQLPPYLPEFIPENGISEEQGKQDKIEISIEGFTARGANNEEIASILKYMGAPPPVYQGDKRTRTRQNHGSVYGYIFNTIDTRKWEPERIVKIRRSPLTVESEVSGRTPPPPMQSPLYSGVCQWSVVNDEEKPVTPFKMTGKLNLSINPTRFMVHRPTDERLPKGILKRNVIRGSTHGEASYDGDDNWLPIDDTFREPLTPEGWQSGLSRYLKKIVKSVGGELTRACGQVDSPRETDRLTFNVKKVETYFEFASEETIGLVNDLETLLFTFSSGLREKRTYKTTTKGINRDQPFLKIQTATGEWLKIYAKTNRRIRIEVTHLLTGEDRFQFSREYARIGRSTRSNRHTFDSEEGAVSFLNRVRKQAAKVANQFLAHVAERTRVISTPISKSQALLDIAWALHDYRKEAGPITSLLINNQCISVARWPESWQRALNSLCEQKIIKMRKDREVYRITPRYLPAVEELKKLGLFPVLENKPSPPQADGALNSEGNKVRVRHRVTRVRRRIAAPAE